MIGVRCVNNGGPQGMLADIEPLGIVSDATWKCSNTPTLGWSAPSFVDSGWPQAVEQFQNGAGPWGSNLIGQINRSAMWIWAQDATATDVSYCRYTLGIHNILNCNLTLIVNLNL